MHKSIILLLGTLTFLLPVGPSIMSNSNVMAIEDYGDEADQYESYVIDMTNDNYYKSQGNDFIKKIKCNNINSNFNGVEANIGTDDSLGGIGAESLEADDTSANWFGNVQTNGNFDVNCINNNDNENTGGDRGTGIVGPRGIPGPPGEIGERGPPGITELNDDNTYERTRDLFVGPAGPSTTVAQGFLRCDVEDSILSGGYSLSDLRTYRPFIVTENGPLSNISWAVSIISPEPDATNIGGTMTIKCFDNPPVMTLATADISAFQQQPEDSPITSQVKGDSPELTATEKITKLKQQWLELLP